jgi:hypothetical protein
MAKTTTQLVAQVAALVTSLIGESAAATDSTFLTGLVQPVVDDLAERNICNIGNIDEIPDSHFLHLAVLVAQEAIIPYGGKYDPNAVALRESRLRTLSRIGQGTGALLTVDQALLPRTVTFNFTTGE